MDILASPTTYDSSAFPLGQRKGFGVKCFWLIESGREGLFEYCAAFFWLLGRNFYLSTRHNP